MLEKTDIFILDLDGTLILTEKIIEEKQISAILKLMYNNKSLKLKNSLSENKLLITELKNKLRNEFSENTLQEILKKFGFTTDELYSKNIYRSFEPFIAASNKKIKIYPDALLFLKQISNNHKFIVSNSSLEVTKNKLKALEINSKNFDLILAEYLKDKAKPNPFMGLIILQYLTNKNLLKNNPKIYCIGDQENDILFGENLKSYYKNIITVFINRKQNKLKTIKPDIEISNLRELFFK